jgi:hypothetical protein
MTNAAYLQDLYAKRDLLLKSLDGSLENGEVQSFSLSDSDGAQSTSRRSPAELLTALEKINLLIKKAGGDGGGVHYMTMRRGL